MNDPSHDDFAALGVPKEAAPITTASTLLARADRPVPLVLGWLGWQLYASWLGMLGTGALLGAVVTTAMVSPRTDTPAESSVGAPQRVEVVHRYPSGGPIVASHDPPSTRVRVTLLRNRAANAATEGLAMADAGPDRGRDPDLEPGTGALSLPKDDPPPLDALIQAAATLDPSRETPVSEDRRLGQPSEWRAHVVVGGRRGVGLISKSRGLGMSTGAEYYPRTSGALGLVLSARTDLAMVGVTQRTELVASFLEAGLARPACAFNSHVGQRRTMCIMSSTTTT
jgi:hypothetical protein